MIFSYKQDGNMKKLKTLSIGKMRGLQQCATPQGKFAILALDHRNNMRRLLHPENEELTSSEEIAAFKKQVVTCLGEIPSAYLLDPLYGAAQNIASAALPGSCGLLLAIEESGYTGDASARRSRLLPNWPVEKIKRMGANGVKLLVYYHPRAETHADIENLVQKLAEDCLKADIPYFLEILTYPLDPARKKLSGDERTEVILESARRLTPLGADVLKAEFPLDIEQHPDHADWERACRELTAASTLPWILLSASVEFEVYLRQVEAACKAGASGVAAGRAIWKEAADLPPDERPRFLDETARERMRKVRELVDALGRPWTDCFQAQAVDENWYRSY